MTTALDLDLKKLRSRAFDREEWAEGGFRRYHARKGLFARGHGENGGKPVWEIWACNAFNYKPIVQKYGLTLGLTSLPDCAVLHKSSASSGLIGGSMGHVL